ncbi:MAG: hypothetical protein JWM09_683 [Francisellaceae bacterium]|nr:hypothetical protein [Francisellaceae bacterium]
MKAHLRFIYLSICINLRLALALKSAFVITMILTILKQVLFLMTWKFFFKKYPLIQGWTFQHMLLMYGIVTFSMGLIEAFFIGIKDLPKIIESSHLDIYLLQPKNLILNIALSKGDMSAIGEIITGILLLSYSGFLIKAFPTIVLILILSALFMFSLLLYLGCIAFCLKNSTEFIQELNLNSIITATQPNASYKGAFKWLTFTILPVGFLSFFPIEYLRTGLNKYLFITILGNLLFFLIANIIFRLGLKHYESNNNITFRQ